MVNKLIDNKVPVRGLTAFYLLSLCLLWSYFVWDYINAAHIFASPHDRHFFVLGILLLWHGHGNAVSHCDCRRVVFYLSRCRPARHEPVAVDICCHLHTQPAGDRYLPDPAQAAPDGVPRLPGKAGTSVVVLPAVRPPIQAEMFRMRRPRGTGTSILRVLRRQFEGTWQRKCMILSSGSGLQPRLVPIRIC